MLESAIDQTGKKLNLKLIKLWSLQLIKLKKLNLKKNPVTSYLTCSELTLDI